MENNTVVVEDKATIVNEANNDREIPMYDDYQLNEGVTNGGGKTEAGLHWLVKRMAGNATDEDKVQFPDRVKMNLVEGIESVS